MANGIGCTKRALVGMACVTVLLVPGSASAQFNCGDTIPAKTKVTFTTDLGPCTTSDGATALTIESGAKVDLAGHTVLCDTGDRPDGIRLTGKGVKVSNGVVVSCNDGIVLDDDGKHKLTAIVVDDAAGQGVHAMGAGGNKLTRVDVHGSGVNGFELESDKNNLKDTSSTDNGGDGYHVDGDRNKLSRCIAAGNDDDGFDFLGTQNKLDASLGAANGNSPGIRDGVTVDGAGTNVKNTRAVANMGHGVRVESIDAKVTKVVALMNDLEDTKDENPNCGTNSWKKNIFGTSEAGGVANPPCIE